MKPRHLLIATLLFGTAILPSNLSATLVMTLSGTSGSSIVTATFSGSSIAPPSGGGSIGGIGWGFAPGGFDPFPAQITGGDFGVFGFTGGAATITIGGVSHNMSGVFLQDSSNSPSPGFERFGTIGFIYQLTPGQLFEWSGSATFDLSGKGLTFDDLNPGSSGPVAAGGFPEGQLVVIGSVPDGAATALLLGVALSGFGMIRRRLRKTAA